MNNNTVLGINLAENDDIGKSFEDWNFFFFDLLIKMITAPCRRCRCGRTRYRWMTWHRRCNDLRPERRNDTKIEKELKKY